MRRTIAGVLEVMNAQKEYIQKKEVELQEHKSLLQKNSAMLRQSEWEKNDAKRELKIAFEQNIKLHGANAVLKELLLTLLKKE